MTKKTKPSKMRGLVLNAKLIDILASGAESTVLGTSTFFLRECIRYAAPLVAQKYGRFSRAHLCIAEDAGEKSVSFARRVRASIWEAAMREQKKTQLNQSEFVRECIRLGHDHVEKKFADE